MPEIEIIFYSGMGANWREYLPVPVNKESFRPFILFFIEIKKQQLMC
jgi:hypothetical protein